MNVDKHVWDWRTFVLKEGPENSSYKHLLLVLSCYMDSAGGSCFPAIKTLVEDTSMSRPTVIKYLKKAREDGWIIVKKHGLKGQQWARNEYTANLPESLKKAVNSVNHDQKKAEKAVNSVNHDQKKAEKAVKPVNHPPPKAVKEVNHLPRKAVNSVNKGGKTDSERRLTQLSTISPYNSTSNSPKRARPREAENSKNPPPPVAADTREGKNEPPRINGCPLPESLARVDGFVEKFEFYLRYMKENFNRWPTATTTELKLHKLAYLQQQGNYPIAVINQTIDGLNKSFYPLRDFDSDGSDKAFDPTGRPNAGAYTEYEGD